MRYDLRSLRSNNLAHLLAAIGLAGYLRGQARVAWDRSERFCILESDRNAMLLEVTIADGFNASREDHRNIISVPPLPAVGSVQKTQGNKGRPTTTKAKDARLTRLPTPASVTAVLGSLRSSAQEVMPSIFCFSNTDADGALSKTRAMLGKTRFYQLVADDEMGLQNRQAPPPVLDELADPQRMTDSIFASRSQKIGTAFDHTTSAVNMGINQSQMGKERRPHPVIEMLAIEGMKALPAVPCLGANPIHRGMKRTNGTDVMWEFPVWAQPLGYYEIEDLLADSRNRVGRWNDLVEVRRFEIVTNGKVQMVRPKEVIRP